MPKAPTIAINANNRFMVFPLKGIGTGLTGPNAHDLFEFEDESFAVADFSRVRCLFDRFDDAVEHFALDRGLDLYLRQKIHDVFSPPVQLGVPLLSSEALDFCDSDPLNSDGRKGLADLVQLERLDDCGDQFHFSPLERWCQPC